MPDLRLHKSPSQPPGLESRIGNGEHCVTSARVVAKTETDRDDGYIDIYNVVV